MLNLPRRSTTSILCFLLLSDSEASTAKEDDTTRVLKAPSDMEGWQINHTVLGELPESSLSSGIAGRHMIVTGPTRSYG